MNPQLAYCTNVHAGADLAQTRDHLERYALRVRQLYSPDRPMGLGLWLSASSARQMIETGQVALWRDWLAAQGLVPFTFNGFPYGDFHQRVVKHQVYHPTWFDPNRLAYTLSLITIQHALLPEGQAGSISTLPIAWSSPTPTDDQLAVAADNLSIAAMHLATLEKDTGRFICLCMEPEPGCVIQRSGELVRFFDRFLFRGPGEAAARRHLRVCHDICHQAIQFEEQTAVLKAYRAAGIGVGKIQVSSAVVLPLDRLPPGEHASAREQLAGFVEERYLHQTVIRTGGAGPIFYEDLPQALASGPLDSSEWRVHFHVPIYLERFGRLETTQFAIRECLQAAGALTDCQHFEAETYAWSVLPAELQQPDLAAGIAQEMHWLEQELNAATAARK